MLKPTSTDNYLRNILRLTFIIGYAFTTSVHGQQIDDKLKDSLLKGYMLSCVPTIQRQLPRTDRIKIIAYCSCVGGKTFQNVTQKQYDHITRGSLPPEIEAQRITWRSQCASQLD